MGLRDLVSHEERFGNTLKRTYKTFKKTADDIKAEANEHVTMIFEEAPRLIEIIDFNTYLPIQKFIKPIIYLFLIHNANWIAEDYYYVKYVPELVVGVNIHFYLSVIAYLLGMFALWIEYGKSSKQRRGKYLLEILLAQILISLTRLYIE